MSTAHFNVFMIRFLLGKLLDGKKIFSVNLAWPGPGTACFTTWVSFSRDKTIIKSAASSEFSVQYSREGGVLHSSGGESDIIDNPDISHLTLNTQLQDLLSCVVGACSGERGPVSCLEAMVDRKETAVNPLSHTLCASDRKLLASHREICQLWFYNWRDHW